jgi:hypothetical protein
VIVLLEDLKDVQADSGTPMALGFIGSRENGSAGSRALNGPDQISKRRT